jgi:hypothetical protein
MFKMDANESGKRIDNRNITYVSVTVKSGITLKCTPEVLQNCPSIISTIEGDLEQCLSILPKSTHGLVTRTTIWVNETYRYGDALRPKILRHTTTHHYKEWLLAALDNPEKALGIEIYNCYEYLTSRLHWNGCGLLLHEWAHLIHQIVLGLDCEEVLDIFGDALDSQLYDEVLRRDWAFLDCEVDAHYGTINFKEFFAEISVAYLCRGYSHLDHACIAMGIEACSPLFMDQDVLERRKHVSKFDKESRKVTNDTSHNVMTWFKNILMLNGQQEPPCNKFYPFTHGQLKNFDYHTFKVFDDLWKKIASWEDPLYQTNTGCFQPACIKMNVPNIILGNRSKKSMIDDDSSMTTDEAISESTEVDEIISDSIYL